MLPEDGGSEMAMRANRDLLRFAVLLATSLTVAMPTFAQNTTTSKNGATPGPFHLTVDLQEAPRRIFHARLDFPATPGTLKLYYPKWIAGEHAPDGPIADLVGLKFTARGKTIPWRRDDVDLYAFQIEVPAGVDSVQAAYDYLSPARGEGFSAGPTADPVLAVLEWNLVVLYPAGWAGEALTYQPTLRLPQGWKFASALTVAKQHGDEIDFAPVPLSTLIDSPVLAGQYFRSVSLAPEIQPAHHLDIAADSAAALEMTPEQVEAYSRLVREEGALFGARHYEHYDFLLSLTDYFYPNGLEHHQSSDERAPERMFLGADTNEYFNSLLSHEFTHSWNGKYRRPAGLVSPDFQQPMKGDLLWIYEGLTQYIGEMIAARSGLRTAEDYRESLAANAAYLDHWPGRTWRPLADTAVSAQLLYDVPNGNWASWRRSVDFYDEGWLVWLEADVIIRHDTHGQKSLDDFCRAFYGPPSTPPKLVPYTLDDVIAALNGVLPHDWRAFFHAHIDEIAEHPPLGGIEGGGWRLAYTTAPNQHIRAKEIVDGETDLNYSLGLTLHAEPGEDNGRIADIIPGEPAADAGLAPGMRITAVNGRDFSVDGLVDAIRASKTSKQPIVVTANNSGFVRTYEIKYFGGERYPHLERDTIAPDLLGDTLRPLTDRNAGK
jgi:predicted metalloprotease with PDZ domain